MKRVLKRSSLLAFILAVLMLAAFMPRISSDAAASAYQEPELARAVSLGIGNYAANTTITYKQFFSMLDAAVALASPSTLSSWQAKFPDARVSNLTMRREEGMLAVYFAAETLDADYNATNSPWYVLNDKIGPNAWNDFSFNYPLFPGWDQPAKLDAYTWDTHVVAAYFYSMGRISLYNDTTLFGYDAARNSMRPADPFTYEEALRAALRLYDSGSRITDRVPEAQDLQILNNADIRRNSILNNTSTVSITGTAYYVSNSGNDNNDGLTPNTAWNTIAKVNSMTFQPGDGVFFQRGGLWREVPRCRSNITFAAYGTGPKPKIYGSPENGAAPNKWTLLEGTSNIWVFYKDIYDTSCIVFNDGDSFANRKIAMWDGSKYVEITDNTTPIDVTKLNNLECFSAPDYTGYSSNEATVNLDKKGKLYLRCDAGNPGAVYKSIEFLSSPNSGGNWALVNAEDNCLIDNLCLMYGNQCGVYVGNNCTVQNCEIAWVGGCMTWFSGSELGLNANVVIQGGDGITVRQSNNNTINNYIHHVYDNGLVEETGPWYSDADRYAENNVFKDNLVEKCSGGMCIADWASLHVDYNKPLFNNFTIENNYFMYSGYGWSHQTPDYVWGKEGEVNNGECSLYFGFPSASGTNINFINNVFYLSKYGLVQGRPQLFGDQLQVPVKAQQYNINFSGNTYVQNTFGLLAEWGPSKDDPSITQKYSYNFYARNTVSNVLGDKTGVVLSLQTQQPRYTISFNANGGTGTMPNLPMTYGASKALPANNFTYSGYIFSGWAATPAGPVAYSNGASVCNLTNLNGTIVTLYAKWKTKGDINGDGNINITDLAEIARQYNNKAGQANWNSNYDMNNDGIVDIFDLVFVSKLF